MTTLIIPLLVLLGTSTALTSLQHATIIGRDADLQQHYDFVIIGGGTSGLTVADRLTESPETTILVIEFGPLDHGEPSVLVPGLLNLTSSPYFFNLTSVPQAGLQNATFQVPAAAVVGGGTVVNGMFFDRAAAVDYDAWEELGNSGWGWKDLFPYFLKSENFTPAATGFAQEFDISWDLSVHGSGGPVQSSYPVFQWQDIKNFLNGWHNLGFSTPKDPSSGIKGGCFWAPSSLNPKDETRSYARTVHYDRVISSRPNYHLLTETAIQKILIQDGAAIGVQSIDRNSSQISTVYASKEVILAAGSTHSPQILQLSGIGPSNLLETFGIDQVVELPGVGENFQDHPTLYMAFEFQTQPVPNVNMLSTNQTYASEALTLYWAKRQGPYTIVNQGGNTVAFLPLPEITSNYQSIIDLANSESASSVYSADDATVLAGYEKQRSIILGLYGSTASPIQETGFNGGTVMPVTLIKPLSRGSVTINSTDVLTQPLVDWGALTDPVDLETLIAALRINRALIASEPMQELTLIELSPGSNVTTDDELKEMLRGLIKPTYSHPCCTCPMMPRELGGVVGPDLLVYGVGNLSVVDASIMPMIPGTHLSATVYAIAEKAADIIKARHGIPVYPPQR